jgi:two-component sensor histidine kinase
MPARRWDFKHLRLSLDAAGVALWSWNVATDKLLMDSRGAALWGVEEGPEVPFADLSAHIHPADRDRVQAAFAATRALSGAYEIDFRIMIGQEIRWISARGQGSEGKTRKKVVFGVFLDVTARKQAEEGHELLAGEMSHRVKNLLMIATALTAITSRSATSAADMARELTHRLAALGRAHDLVRPLPEGGARGALLGDLIAVLLAPYDDMGAFSGRIRISVPRMAVGEAAATTLSLVLHELATNSVKYGALSTPAGLLDISCDAPGEAITVVWTESGGPPVTPPAAAQGFGSRLLHRGMRDLGGAVALDFLEGGLVATLTMTAERLGS